MTRVFLVVIFFLILCVPFDTEERSIGYYSKFHESILLISRPLKGLILPEKMVFTYIPPVGPLVFSSTKSFFLKLFWWLHPKVFSVYSGVPVKNVYMIEEALSSCSSDQVLVIDLKNDDERCQTLPYRVTEEGSEIEFIQANYFISTQSSPESKDTKSCQLNLGINCRYLDHPQIEAEGSSPNNLGRFAKCELKKEDVEREYREKVIPLLNYLPYFQIQILNDCLDKIDPGSSLLELHKTILRKREIRSIEI